MRQLEGQADVFEDKNTNEDFPTRKNGWTTSKSFYHFIVEEW